MASSVSAFRSFAFILAVALFCAAVAAAQDLGSSPASEPAPGPEVGAAGSVSSSVAVIGASALLSLLTILKH